MLSIIESDIYFSSTESPPSAPSNKRTPYLSSSSLSKPANILSKDISAAIATMTLAPWHLAPSISTHITETTSIKDIAANTVTLPSHSFLSINLSPSHF